MNVGETHLLLCDEENETHENYHFHSKHRGNSAPKICIWNISVPEEADSFICSHRKRWLDDTTGWGLHLIGERVVPLGRNHDDEVLYIAKFVCDRNTPENLWHGYPADFCRNNQDKPPVRILHSWRDEGYIRKAHVKRIRGGNSCNL